MVEVTLPASISLTPCLPPNVLLSIPSKIFRSKTTKLISTRTKTLKIRAVVASSSSSLSPSVFESFNRTVGEQVLPEREYLERNEGKSKNKKRVFFLDVNPLCYAGNKPSLQSFGHWVSLFFSEVSLTDPVIAVLDGENCNEKRRQLLPSYKAHRRKFFRQTSSSRKFVRSPVRRSQQLIMDVLRKCNLPVIKIEGNEADDVVATLVEQVLQRGYRVVIASPDKDFKQLISENVQIVMPLVELDRWSFYTLKHYIAQYNCDPHSDLSLTAVRTVGKQYAQEALTKYADYLRRNYEVLALRRDVDVHLQEEWLVERDKCNDSSVLSNFFRLLEDSDKSTRERRSNFSNG
ncbi:hypothetical protein REPUB_Repub16aG0017700 [Reevesia pubescens]